MGAHRNAISLAAVTPTGAVTLAGRCQWTRRYSFDACWPALMTVPSFIASPMLPLILSLPCMNACVERTQS